MKTITLKPGRETSLKNRHPWIFSGAIDKYPALNTGELVKVYSSKKEFLALAYANPTQSLFARAISFVDEAVDIVIARRFKEALALRKALRVEESTNAYRLVNGESDLMPGLIVDVYDTTVVVQIHTHGMHLLKDKIVEAIKKLLNLQVVYLKYPSNPVEGEMLPNEDEVAFGKLEGAVTIKENGVVYSIDVVQGQKTGFFLDQREMRKKVGELAKGRRVLNCFSYTGGFSLAALKGGALSVTSIDISSFAAEQCLLNTTLNHFPESKHQVIKCDALEFLDREKLDFDLVILDPPAFVKNRKDIDNAVRAYTKINRRAMEKMPARSILVTSSCSYYMEENLFRKVLFDAAIAAGRNVKIIGKHLHAVDHPISVYHPESEYLKSFILYID